MCMNIVLIKIPELSLRDYSHLLKFWRDMLTEKRRNEGLTEFYDILEIGNCE